MVSFFKVICAVLFVASLTSCSEDIIGNLSQRDMLDAQVLLERSGITVTATKDENNLYTLVGSSGDRSRVLELLAAQGLPRNAHASVAEVFPGGGFLVTPFEQKVRMRYVIEQQLSETLADLDGVAEARVHVVLPEDNGRGLVKEKARASVLLKYRPGADTVAIETRSRALVVNGVQNLSYEDISVVASPWHLGVEPASTNQTIQPVVVSDVVTSDVGSGYFSIFNMRITLVTLAVLLAVCAGVVLLIPRRRES